MSNKMPLKHTPAELGYRFPAEFAPHEATWLSWPHKEASWPDRIQEIYAPYAEFVATIALSEKVRINVKDQEMQNFAWGCIEKALEKTGAEAHQIEFYHFPTNDAWCRDHGPAFLLQPGGEHPKAVVDWNYNAWGNKYPPFDLDDIIPTRIATHFQLPLFEPGIIMEGGSVEFNGKDTLLTSTACLLNPNRNPHLSADEIEGYLKAYYGVKQVLWVDEGIVGDDTDGHIDDTVRFVSEDTVLAVLEENQADENYALLQHNWKQLGEMQLLDGRPLQRIALPMPDPVVYDDQRLPASYANFCITNGHVIVPTFQCAKDEIALGIIQKCFPTRKVVGIDSTAIIWGLGSFHCLSQQEPKV